MGGMGIKGDRTPVSSLGMAMSRESERGFEPDDVRLYLEAAGAEPLLTKEEEVDLAQAIERGEEGRRRLDSGRIRSPRTRARLLEDIRAAERARERFIVSNLRLVVSVAKRYQGQGLTLLDLIQDGNLGLMRAVELFDWRRGFKFSTYATWWIRQAITRAIADRGRTIRLPVHLTERIRKVKATAAGIAQRTGEPPTPEAVAKALKTSPEEVQELIELDDRRPVSLHAPVGEDTELGELLEDTGAQSPEDEVAERIILEQLGEAIDEHLSDQERRVLELRFGLDGQPPRSLREAGRAMGLSAERVRKIEREALARLREVEEIAAA
jgi:RNA polymerase primary sigma factor